MSIKVTTAQNPQDDKEIRGCLKRNPMEGLISITFEAEPSFFDSISVQGDVDVLAAKVKDKVIGIGTRAVKSVYIDGRVSSVGYVGGFRIDKEYRSGTVFVEGVRLMKDLHLNDPQEFYLGSIMEDNLLARKVLEKRRRGVPTPHHLFDMTVYTIKPTKRKVNNEIRIIRGDTYPLEKIIDFINTHGSKKQFFPNLSAEDFNRQITRGLEQNDLYLGFNKDDELVGVVGKWDQSGFKQTRVISYKQPLKALRPIVNLFSPITGNPVLPKEGQKLNSFYSAFNVILNDDPLIYEQLLNELASTNMGYSYFNIGLAKQDPLNKAIKMPCRKNKFRVYGFTYENNEKIFSHLKNNISYFESAML